MFRSLDNITLADKSICFVPFDTGKKINNDCLRNG